MEPASRLERDILDAPTTQALLYTDGMGRAVRAHLKAGDAGELAEALDVAACAITSFGERRFGALQVGALRFRDGWVLFGPRGGGAVVLVTAADVNLGMSLIALRSLITEGTA